MEPNYLPFASSKENEFHVEKKFLLVLLFGFKKMAGWTQN